MIEKKNKYDCNTTQDTVLRLSNTQHFYKRAQYNHYLQLFFFAQQWWHFQAYENIQDRRYGSYKGNVYGIEQIIKYKEWRKQWNGKIWSVEWLMTIEL